MVLDLSERSLCKLYKCRVTGLYTWKEYYCMSTVIKNVDVRDRMRYYGGGGRKERGEGKKWKRGKKGDRGRGSTQASSITCKGHSCPSSQSHHSPENPVFQPDHTTHTFKMPFLPQLSKLCTCHFYQHSSQPGLRLPHSPHTQIILIF